MSIGLVRSALPTIVDWAATDSSEVLSTLIEVQERATKSQKTGLNAIEIIPFKSNPQHAIGYAIDQGMPVVIAADIDLAKAAVQQIAARLLKVNWREHLLKMDIRDIDANDLYATLTDVTGFSNTQGTAYWRHRRFASSLIVDKLSLYSDKWKTGQARHDFRALMEAATARPQLVDRPGGERIFVVSESILDGFAEPLNAQQIVAAFAEPEYDMSMELAPRTAPRPALDLTLMPSIDRSTGA